MGEMIYHGKVKQVWSTEDPEIERLDFSGVQTKVANNFSVEPEFMISEGNKVFVKVIAKADGMDTIFGHYFEINDEGKTIVFTAHDDTLSSKNAMT